ncbi:MAG: hypothetical protein LBI63_01755, partial [Candidatus Ancillula sp.]|nr:hypothetical protein [Candidatus Ancillula sp.]
MAENGTKIGNAYISIVPSFQGVQKAISSEMNMDSTGKTASSNFSSSFIKTISTGAFIKVGQSIASSVMSGIKAVPNMITSLANASSDLSESQNVVEQTFKSSSEQVIKWAKVIGESSGISQTSATKYVGSMGAMLKSSGLSEDAAKNMSQIIVQLSGDMASFYNLDNETAWEKIRSGIAGETEPLKQLGINMSVANLEAYALSSGIEKSYSSMTQAEQVQLRYGYLMKQTADAQGDFSNTSDSLANKTRIAELNFENLNTELGNVLAPTVSDITSKFTELLQENSPELKNALTTINPIIGNIVDGLKWFVDRALPLLTTGLAVLAAGLAGISQNLSTIAGFLMVGGAIYLGATTWNILSTAVNAYRSGLALTTAIQAGLSASLLGSKIQMIALTVATNAQALAQKLLNLVMSANPIGIIIGLIVGLVAAFVCLWNKSEGFRNFFIEMWESIKTGLSNAWEFIKGVFSGVADFFTGVFNSAWEGIKNAFSAVGSFFSGIWDTIKSTFSTIGTAIGDAIGGAFKTVVNTIIGFAENTINGFIRAINTAIKVINLDAKWVISGLAQEETPESIKQKYESNPDTNAYTDTEKQKLEDLPTNDQLTTDLNTKANDQDLTNEEIRAKEQERIIDAKVESKQDTLIGDASNPNQNIKTLGGVNILGKGNIPVMISNRGLLTGTSVWS